MRKVQKNKLNTKDLISYFLRGNSKGVTLASLVLYITIMFVVLAIIIRVVIVFRTNMNDVTDVTFETEFEKFNLYMLQETRKNRQPNMEYYREFNNIYQ